MPGAPPSRQNADPRPVKGTGPGRQDLPRARRADGIRVHLLGAAERGGHLLDHLEVGVKHNETSHFTQLLEPLDLDGAVVTFDALHTVRASLAWLGTGKKAHYIAMLEQLFLHGVLVEAGDRAQAAGDGRPGAATGFQVAGEALDVGRAHLEQAQVVLLAPGRVLAQVSAYASRVKPV